MTVSAKVVIATLFGLAAFALVSVQHGSLVAYDHG